MDKELLVLRFGLDFGFVCGILGALAFNRFVDAKDVFSALLMALCIGIVLTFLSWKRIQDGKDH